MLDELRRVFDYKDYNHIINYHQKRHSLEILTINLHTIIKELEFHHELKENKKLDLLTNLEYVSTSSIREKGLNNLPNEWINKQTKEVDQQKLDEIWLRPCPSHTHKRLMASSTPNDKLKLEMLKKKKSWSYRGLDKSEEERKQHRLSKLTESIKTKKIAILLGRHNMTYRTLKNNLNKQEHKVFISDHTWSNDGYTEPGAKVSDNLLSILQAAETVRKLSELDFTHSQIEGREIAFSLDGYNHKVGLSAIYSNPNYIARSRKAPEINYISNFKFAYTGLTDLELANIVRNPAWFTLTTFYRTGINGQPEKLTHQYVASHYGIKCISQQL